METPIQELIKQLEDLRDSIPDEDVSMWRPSGEKTADKNAASGATSFSISLPVATSQIRAVLSCAQVTTLELSALKAASVTSAV